MGGESPEQEHAPLRLLMTADAVGGVWQYATDLIRALTRSGDVQVLLATFGPRPSLAQKRQLDGLANVALAESDFALEWMPDPWSEVDAAGRWLLDLDSRFRADVVHLNGFSHAALAWNKPVLCVAHSCVSSWWRAVHNAAPGEEWAEYKHRVAAGLAASTAVVAPSKSMARSIAEEYGLPWPGVSAIHNFSDIQERDRKQKDAYILAIGRVWDRAKNLELLEKIAPDLDWPVRVAGNTEGPGQSSDPAHLQLLGTLPRVRLETQLERASIFAHPALYEPFGLAVLEAARSGCSLVLADIPSLRELWGGAAIFLDPRDPELWRFELNALCRDFRRRSDLAERAVKHSRRYQSESAAAEYRELYHSLLSGGVAKGVAA